MDAKPKPTWITLPPDGQVGTRHINAAHIVMVVMDSGGDEDGEITILLTNGETFRVERGDNDAVSPVLAQLGIM